MKLLEEKIEEQGKEKHLPVVERSNKGILVKVGSVPHPMEETHYIEWIEVETKENLVLRKFLRPGDKPEAEFEVMMENISVVREYCNIHGLWAEKL
jgi:superoxide reductase